MNNSAEMGLAVKDYLVDIINENSLLFTFLLKVNNKEDISLIYANNSGASYFTQTSELGNTFFSQVILEQLLILFDSFIDEKQKIFPKQSIIIQNEVYIFDISIVRIDEMNHIYGLTMLNKTNEVKELDLLSEMKEKYLSLVNNNLDSVFSINESGIILSSNIIVLKDLGYDAEYLHNKPIEQFIEENSMGNFQFMMKQTLSGYATEMHNCLIQHEKGIIYHVY